MQVNQEAQPMSISEHWQTVKVSFLKVMTTKNHFFKTPKHEKKWGLP